MGQILILLLLIISLLTIIMSVVINIDSKIVDFLDKLNKDDKNE